MKRFLIILMTVVLAASLFGCGGDINPEGAVMAPPAEEPPNQNSGQSEGTEGFIVEEVKDANGNVLKRSITGEAGEVNVFEYTPEGYELSHTEYLPDGRCSAIPGNGNLMSWLPDASSGPEAD